MATHVPTGLTGSGQSMGMGQGMGMGMSQESGLSDLTNMPEWMQLVVKEHRIAQQLHDEFMRLDDMAQKQMKAQVLMREIAIHGNKEEMALYPVVRAKLGDQVVERAKSEHLVVKQLLYKIDGKNITEPGYIETLEQGFAALMQHIQEEEQGFLRDLDRTLNDQERMDLARAYDAATAAATTHPHPSAPAEGLGAMAANIASQPLDRLKDMASGVSKEASKYEQQTGRT